MKWNPMRVAALISESIPRAFVQAFGSFTSLWIMSAACNEWMTRLVKVTRHQGGNVVCIIMIVSEPNRCFEISNVKLHPSLFYSCGVRSCLGSFCYFVKLRKSNAICYISLSFQNEKKTIPCVSPESLSGSLRKFYFGVKEILLKPLQQARQSNCQRRARSGTGSQRTHHRVVACTACRMTSPPLYPINSGAHVSTSWSSITPT